MSTRFHVALSVDVDRFTDAQLRRQWLRGLRIGGAPATVASLRYACEQARAAGLEVFPHPECDNRLPSGSCAGHPEP